MVSSSRSHYCFTVLSYCLLSSLLTLAAAFSVPIQTSDTTISPIYHISRWSNVSTSFLTQVQSLDAPSVSGHNVVATDTRVRVVDKANVTSSLAPQIVSTTFMDLTSPTSSPTKMNATIPGIFVHVTKTESVSSANKTKSAISQTLASHSHNATSPTIALTTANITMSYMLNTTIKAPSPSKSQSTNSSIAGSSSSLTSLYSIPSKLHVTSARAQTSAVVISSSRSLGFNTKVANPNGTASALPSVTQVLNYTSSRVATTAVKSISSKYSFVNSTTTRSACTSCASSSMSSMGSTVKSATSTALKTKSTSDQVRTSSSSGVTHWTSVSSSATVFIHAPTSKTQIRSSVSILPSSTILTNVYGSSSHTARTSSVRSKTSVSSSTSSSRTKLSKVHPSSSHTIKTTSMKSKTKALSSTSPSSTTLTEARPSGSHTTKTTSVKSKTTVLRPSSKPSLVKSNQVTSRTSRVKLAPSTTDSPTTIQTISAGNDTIFVLPREAVRRPSSTQSIRSTSAAMPTALPPVDPAQHAKHVGKLAEIIAPTVAGGSGLGITVSWAIWNFLRKTAEAAGRTGVEVVEEQSAAVQVISRTSSLSRLPDDFDWTSDPASWPGNVWRDIDRTADIENSILQEEAVNPGILTLTEAAQIEEVVTAPPPASEPLPGDIPTDDPPSTEDPPTVEPPSEPEPQKYDDPRSVQFADKLPPMGEPEIAIQGNLGDYIMRKVPEAYRDLSFDAKIFYVSKYGENVWSRTLVYSDGAAAAVGPDNKPLPDRLVLDSAGNIVSYHGIPLHDLETFGFPTEGSWEQQQAKLKEIQRSTKKMVKKEMLEQQQVRARQRYENQQKNKARIKKMNEGLEKIQKARLKNEEAVENGAMEIAKGFENPYGE